MSLTNALPANIVQFLRANHLLTRRSASHSNDKKVNCVDRKFADLRNDLLLWQNENMSLVLTGQEMIPKRNLF